MEQQPEAPESFSAEAVADVVQGAERLAREQVARVIADRFRQIEPAVRARLDQEFERSARARVEEARREANREFSEQLSRCVRRMREDAARWPDAMLDATVGMCRAAALFAIEGGQLSLIGARGAARGTAAEVGGTEVGNGSVLDGVVTGGRTGFASREELPAGVAGLLGRGPDARIALVPVVVRGETRNVLCAEGVADLGALEMIAGIAATVLEAGSAAARGEIRNVLCAEGVADLGALEMIADIAATVLEAGSAAARPAEAPTAPPALPAVAPAPPAAAPPLPAEIAAKRFARMAVARIVLERFGDLQRGRAAGAVYRELAEPLDAARGEYRRTHLDATGRDWLHEEIVRSLGQGRVDALGSEYPGPLG